MGEKIALGFHTCVDYELKWDLDAVINAIKEYGPCPLHRKSFIKNFI